jgi:hypothetical protein
LRSRQAAGATIALLGAIAFAAAFFRGATQRGPFEDGLLSAVLAYERALALFGFGFAVARQRPLTRVAIFLSLVAGIAAGIVSEGGLANSAFVADHLFVLKLPGPISAVMAGGGLALPLFLQKWTLPPLAAVLGFFVGLATGLASPAGDAIAFSTGAMTASLWVAFAPTLLCLPLHAPWARIFVRILGSWLIAIGVMLGGTQLIPPKLSPEEAPPPPPATLFPDERRDDFRQP